MASAASGQVDDETFPLLSPRDQAGVLRALLAVGETARAAALAERGDQNSILILDLRADALLLDARAQEALELIRERETRGTSSVSLGLHTRALSQLGRLDEALALIAAQEDSESYLARCIRGEAYLEAQRPREARVAFEAAVVDHPYRRRGLSGLVDACGQCGDWVSGSAFAARLLETASDEDGPLPPRTLERLARFYEDAGEELRASEMRALLADARADASARLATGGVSPSLVRLEPKAAPRPHQEVPIQREIAVSRPPTLSPAEVTEIEELVQKHLGFHALREGQAETIARVLRGENVLAIMPTGGGKSICYQLPGVLSQGLTVVISPLIALMRDQGKSLPPAMQAAQVALHSGLSPAEARRVLDEVATGRYRLLYIAPERLRNPALLAALRRAGVVRVVVDEAHCVSVWGHDFRPDYLAINDARQAMGNPPVLALTATAPPRVERDILARLGEMEVVRASVARPNLRYEAIHARDADEKLTQLLKLCRETPGPGVVYATSRAKCEQLAAALVRAGLRAEPYHAGLPDRAAREARFMADEIDILVATVAFGMGVDKGNVRFIFHHDPASSLENYAQESGRAGRDGAPARCVVIGTNQDGGLLRSRAKGDLPSRSLIDSVWTLIAQGQQQGDYAFVQPGALAALDEDDVKPRVALSILCEAGAAERLADVPPKLQVWDVPDSVDGRELTVFEAAEAFGVTPEEVEPFLVARQAEGRLRFKAGASRVHLLRVKSNTSGVDTVLSRYKALAEQRAKEMMDYVRTTRCRHQYIQSYFGEEGSGSCSSCDNCLGITHETAAGATSEDDETAARMTLTALQNIRGLGERNLLFFLRGDSRAPPWLVGKPGGGSLDFRSETAIKNVIRVLLSKGLLQRETLDHGGTVLQISEAGRNALHSEEPLLARASNAGPPAGGTSVPTANVPTDPVAAARLHQLKAWRKNRAAADGVPAYVVAVDAALLNIAAENPGSEAELMAIRGMGPARVAKYGSEILNILAATPSGQQPSPDPTGGAIEPRPRAVQDEPPLSPEQQATFEALRAWRIEVARAQAISAFIVAPDRVLRAIARQAPTAIDELQQVPGLGAARLERYGDAILSVLRAHKAES